MNNAMMQSVQANRNLRRGRDHLFERKVDRPPKKPRYRKHFAPASQRARDKFQRQLRRELFRERWQAALGVVLMILFSVSIYFLL